MEPSETVTVNFGLDAFIKNNCYGTIEVFDEKTFEIIGAVPLIPNKNHHLTIKLRNKSKNMKILIPRYNSVACFTLRDVPEDMNQEIEKEQKKCCKISKHKCIIYSGITFIVSLIATLTGIYIFQK